MDGPSLLSRLRAGDWTGSGAAETQTSAQMGFWHMQSKDFSHRLLCRLPNYNILYDLFLFSVLTVINARDSRTLESDHPKILASQKNVENSSFLHIIITSALSES